MYYKVHCICTQEGTHQLPTVQAVEVLSTSSSAESDGPGSPTVLHPSRQTSGETLLTRVTVGSSSSESSFEDDGNPDVVDVETGPFPLSSHVAEGNGGEVERLRADNEELRRVVAECKEQLRKETHR